MGPPAGQIWGASTAISTVHLIMQYNAAAGVKQAVKNIAARDPDACTSVWHLCMGVSTRTNLVGFAILSALERLQDAQACRG